MNLYDDIKEFLDGLDDLDNYKYGKLQEIVSDQFNIPKDKAKKYIDLYISEEYRDSDDEYAPELTQDDMNAGQWYESLEDDFESEQEDMTESFRNLEESKVLTESIQTLDRNSVNVGTYNYTDIDPYCPGLTYNGPYSQDRVDQAWSNFLAKSNGQTTFNTPSDEDILYVASRCFIGMNGSQQAPRARITWPENDVNKEDAYALCLLAFGYCWNHVDKAKFTGIGLSLPRYGNNNVSIFLNTYCRYVEQRGFILGVLLYGNDIFTNIVDRLPEIKSNYEAKLAAKAARAANRKPRAQRVQTPVAATPGTLTLSNQIGSSDIDRFFPALNDIVTAGYNVSVTSLEEISPSRGQESSRMAVSDVIIGTAPDNIRIDGLVSKRFQSDAGRGNTAVAHYYSGPGFKNLPGKQFTGWVLRELERKQNEVPEEDAFEEDEYEESYQEPSAFDIDENKFLEREGFEGYYESLKESDEYTKKDCLRDLRNLTSNFEREEGTVTAWDIQSRDLARDILRDHYDKVEVSDGRMSDDEEPSYVIAYYNRKR